MGSIHYIRDMETSDSVIGTYVVNFRSREYGPFDHPDEADAYLAELIRLDGLRRWRNRNRTGPTS